MLLDFAQHTTRTRQVTVCMLYVCVHSHTESKIHSTIEKQLTSSWTLTKYRPHNNQHRGFYSLVCLSLCLLCPFVCMPIAVQCIYYIAIHIHWKSNYCCVARTSPIRFDGRLVALLIWDCDRFVVYHLFETAAKYYELLGLFCIRSHVRSYVRSIVSQAFEIFVCLFIYLCRPHAVAVMR